MSMTAARLRIHGDYRDLMIAWRRTSERWKDPVSRAFEKKRLEPVALRIRATVGAMEKIESMIAQARRECGDS